MPFYKRHPYLFSFLILLMVIISYLVAGTIATLQGLSTISIYILGNGILTVLTILLMTTLGMWRQTGFIRKPAQTRDLGVFWLAFIPAIVNLAFGVKAQTAESILIWLALAISVGVVEEGLFRGLILQALIPKGLWRAAIISAVVFGISHALNVLGGSAPAYVLLQIGYALAMGFAFAAMVLRTGLLWPLVVAHALIDFFGFIAADRAGAAGVDTATMAISAIYIVIFTAYGIYLMRRIK